MSPAEVKAWREQADVMPVSVQGRDGTWSDAWAAPDIEERLDRLGQPCSRLRILNPFDPVVRDRDRILRLFGFYYRVEMFVPAAKRIWGYYIYPLLEGDRFVGRIEIKADRARDVLDVKALWREPRVTWTAARSAKLDAELARLARFVGVRNIDWACTADPSDPIALAAS